MSAIAVRTDEVMPRKVPPSLSRAEGPKWGDEVRAAYLQAKRHFDPGMVTYAAVAARVSQLVPTTDTSILRLGYHDDVPNNAGTRQIAYLALMAMGFDPSEFGLTPQDRGLKGYTDIELRKLLDPGHIQST